MKEINGIKFYETSDLCALLGLSKQTIAKKRREGLLPYITLQRYKLTSEEALKKFLNGETEKKVK